MTRPGILVARACFPDLVDSLREHFEVEENAEDREFTREELIDRLRGKSGAITTSTERIDAEVLRANPQLRVVCNMAVGYNNFDVAACTERGVLCTNAPDVLTETTADLGFALMMAAARRIAEGERYLRAGLWKKWSYDLLVGSDVHGATLGILGMGRIGQAVARRGRLGFGMKVIYHNRSRLDPSIEGRLDARWVDLPTLMGESDHLVIVVPYSAASHHLVGEAQLALMKPTATLTNIARGGVVDDAALAQALKDRRLAAAALDVFEGEPEVHPGLLEVPNVVLTPHIGSATEKTRRAMFALAAENLVAALGRGPRAGRPPSPINPEVLARWAAGGS